MTETFRRLSAAVGMSRFFGELTIDDGRVTFAPTGAMNALLNLEPPRAFVHRDRPVLAVRARLLPPNVNSAIVLRDEVDQSPASLVARVDMPGWTFRKVLRAMEAYGLVAHRRRTWFGLAGEVGTVAELDRTMGQSRT